MSRSLLLPTTDLAMHLQVGQLYVRISTSFTVLCWNYSWVKVITYCICCWGCNRMASLVTKIISPRLTCLFWSHKSVYFLQPLITDLSSIVMGLKAWHSLLKELLIVYFASREIVVCWDVNEICLGCNWSGI